MILRTERYTVGASTSSKPNRVVSYYLFGFILIYRNEKRQVTPENVFPKAK
jgi:hypothetical protein